VNFHRDNTFQDQLLQIVSCSDGVDLLHRALTRRSDPCSAVYVSVVEVGKKCESELAQESDGNLGAEEENDEG